jgi:hypothetical protein
MEVWTNVRAVVYAFIICFSTFFLFFRRFFLTYDFVLHCGQHRLIHFDVLRASRSEKAYYSVIQNTVWNRKRWLT